MSTDNVNETTPSTLDEEQAKHLGSLLDSHAERLSMRTIQQLENSRKKAVAHHEGLLNGTVNADGSISGVMSWLGHHRLTMASLVLLTVLVSFLVLQNMQVGETSDAFLLGADLPPEAFVDLGFEPSLNR